MSRHTAVLLLLTSIVTVGQSADQPTLAVVEKVAGRVSFYNASRQRIGEVSVGNFPHEAVLDPTTKLLYVSVNGVLWMTEDATGVNKIAAIDTRTMKKVAEIDLGRFHRPHGLARIPSSGQVLATTERPFGLVLVDPKSRKVVRDFDVKGKSPHMVILSPDEKRAWVSNTDSGAVAAIELGTGATTLIPTGARPQGGVLHPSGKQLYLTVAGANRLAVIDTQSNRLTSFIETGKEPGRVSITPDGKTLVYNLQGDLAVGFADTASGKQTHVLDIKGRSLSLTMTQDGQRAFAGIQDQDRIVEIDVRGGKILREIPLPPKSGPDPVIPLE